MYTKYFHAFFVIFAYPGGTDLHLLQVKSNNYYSIQMQRAINYWPCVLLHSHHKEKCHKSKLHVTFTHSLYSESITQNQSHLSLSLDWYAPKQALLANFYS